MPITRAMRPGPLRVGQDFGPRYHIVKLLGSGGMGVVYQAFDVELNEDVALKVLRAPARPTSASASIAEMQRRFRAELVLARKVTHKHVIRIHDIGEIDGIKFISMPLIKGRDLAAILEDGPLPAERALRYARQVVNGLMAVHAAGVIHRDLKPSNVMIDQHDQVVLMDFGIARSNAPGTTPRTMAGAVVGTTAYMAPEQARAEAVDERTDIYGCGLILYEMLAGPRTNLTLAELMARMKAPPVSTRQVNPTVAAELDAIVTKCLQPAASDRYQTSAALAEALHRLRRGRKRRVAMSLTMPPWLTRVASAAALVAAVAALAWWLTTAHGTRSIRAGQAAAARAMDRLIALNPGTLLAREPETGGRRAGLYGPSVADEREPETGSRRAGLYGPPVADEREPETGSRRAGLYGPPGADERESETGSRRAGLYGPPVADERASETTASASRETRPSGRTDSLRANESPLDIDSTAGGSIERMRPMDRSPEVDRTPVTNAPGLTTSELATRRPPVVESDPSGVHRPVANRTMAANRPLALVPFAARQTEPVVLSAARAVARTRPLAPQRQDRDVWMMVRSLATAAKREDEGATRLVAADLSIARGDYDGAAVVLVSGLERTGSWLDRVLLGTVYARSETVADAFEEFQVCHLPPKDAEATAR